MVRQRADHIPRGNPCTLCGLLATQHRVEHNHAGHANELCRECGLPEFCHKKRWTVRKKIDTRESRAGRNQVRPVRDKIFAGIDGEGQGREHHKYVLLAVSDASGKHQWYVEDHGGLSTEKCLWFIVNIPQQVRLFAYSFNYDLTKILADVDNKALYELFRPELRQRVGLEASKGPWPVRWRDWWLNLQGTKFSVGHDSNKRMRVVWDVWKFYQGKFVSALDDWKVGSEEEVEELKYMKDHRGEFDKEPPERVRAYCFRECQFMAQLVVKLVKAHNDAGLKLTDFYGAGSSAKAMLKKMAVKRCIEPAPEEMKEAVASGFFGGRFENLVIGGVDKRVYSYDISSAYPYQLCFLPCLAHGVWEYTESRADVLAAAAAIVKYTLSDTTRVSKYWAPLPFRGEDGSICFPSASGGGWVWRDEYLAAEGLFAGHVEFHGAWIYHTDCDCRPFADIPHYYRERCRIGKEGPGIVLKLGSNSCYGKLAQSVGRGQFNSWIWAGIITSGCRAQILQALALHRDWGNLLMVATDGIHTLERLDMPAPRETGTAETGKPLGGWELKIIEKGVFYARPGVYFPMNPTAEEIKAVRGRGVGRSVVLENWRRIVDTWENQWPMSLNGYPEATVANVSRFCGAKSSISCASGVYNRASGWHTHPTNPQPRYGEWLTRQVRVNFNPMPKRAGVTGENRLVLREMAADLRSMPYRKALASRSPESRALSQAAMILSEQPDGDFCDYR